MAKPNKDNNIKFMMSYKLLRLPDISLGAKVLYALIYSRYNCSLQDKNREHFTDLDGETYCILTNAEACKLLHCSQPTATKCFRELDDAKLIHRVKRGHNRADLVKLVLGVNAID